MTDADYGHVVSCFLLAYALAHPFVGRFMDRVGPRRGLALAFVWWSLASIAHMFARGVVSFSVARFALGIGESGNFPAAIKTVREWFPAKERALATGILNVGSGLGAVIAPPLIGWLIIAYGWQAAFAVTGAAGFVWLVPWLCLSGRPEDHPRITPQERAYILSGQEAPADAQPAGSHGGSWRDALTRREVWVLICGKILTEPVWFLLVMWLPKYFKAERGFDLKQIALYTWLPFLAADFGSIFGGWLSSYCLRRGLSVIAARKLAIGICVAVMPAAILAIYVESWVWAIACLSLCAFGHQGWSANNLTLPADIFPKRMVALCFGVIAMMGLLSAAVAQWEIGHLVESIGYAPVFVVAGFMHPLAGLILALFLPSRAATPKNET